jgi:hypothetical protein
MVWKGSLPKSGRPVKKWFVCLFLLGIVSLGAFHNHGLDRIGHFLDSTCISCTLHKSTDDNPHPNVLAFVSSVSGPLVLSVGSYAPAEEHFISIQLRAPPRV